MVGFSSSCFVFCRNRKKKNNPQIQMELQGTPNSQNSVEKSIHPSQFQNLTTKLQ
jgi:hypothetical protein